MSCFSIVGESLDPDDYKAYKSSFRSPSFLIMKYFKIELTIFSDFDKGTGKLALNCLQVSKTKNTSISISI